MLNKNETSSILFLRCLESGSFNSLVVWYFSAFAGDSGASGLISSCSHTPAGVVSFKRVNLFCHLFFSAHNVAFSKNKRPTSRKGNYPHQPHRRAPCGAAESSSVNSQTPSGSVKMQKSFFWGVLSLLDPEKENILWH